METLYAFVSVLEFVMVVVLAGICLSLWTLRSEEQHTTETRIALKDSIIADQDARLNDKESLIKSLRQSHLEQEDALRIVFGIDAPTLAWMEEETGAQIH